MKYQSEYSTEWQTKFAWFPVYVDDSESKVWLEKYEIRYVPHDSKCTCGCRVAGTFETRSLS